MLKKFYPMLNPHGNWFNNEGKEKNLLAKEALYEFYEEFKKYKPSKDCKESREHRIQYFGLFSIMDKSYSHYLSEIKKAIREQKYMRVCNELISLMYYEPASHEKIHCDVLKLLEEKLL